MLTPYLGTVGMLADQEWGAPAGHREEVSPVWRHLERNMVTISDAARLAGCGVETIRFYERQGLIERPPKPAAGFRRYPEGTVDRVRFIRQAQKLGFTLREVGELLSLRADPTAGCADVRRRAAAKLAEVEGKIAQLVQIRDALKCLMAACPGEGGVGACSIIEAVGSAYGVDAT